MVIVVLGADDNEEPPWEMRWNMPTSIPYESGEGDAFFLGSPCINRSVNHNHRKAITWTITHDYIMIDNIAKLGIFLFGLLTTELLVINISIVPNILPKRAE
jgi:hypothetical protein